MAFGGINPKANPKVLKYPLIKDSLIYDHSNVPTSGQHTILQLIIDELYDNQKIRALCRYIEMRGFDKYMIFSALRYNVPKDKIGTTKKASPAGAPEDDSPIRQGLIEFYTDHQSDFYSRLIPGMPVITFGPALYAVTCIDDIYPSHMQQIIFGKSCFWYSRTLTEKGNMIYPCESLDVIFGDTPKWGKPLDSYRSKLFDLQLDLAHSRGEQFAEYPTLVKHFIESSEDFLNVFYLPNKDRKNEYLAWDLETSSLDFMTGKIGCITLSFDGIEGYYIPWRYVDVSKLNEIMSNNKLVSANGKFDYKFVRRNGIKDIYLEEDIIQMGHTLDETRSNSLKALAFLYSEYGGYETPLDEYKKHAGKSGAKVDNYLTIPETILRDYAVMDAIVTMRVYNNMIRHLRDLDRRYPNEFFPGNTMEHYYRTYRMPAFNMYADIEYEGVYVDPEKLTKARELIREEEKKTKEQLAERFKVSKDFNFNSDAQVAKLLEDKGWECNGRGTKNQYLVGKQQLKLWMRNGHEEAGLLLTLGSLSTLLGTFTGYGYPKAEDDCGWASCLRYHPEDNSYRMHPSFLSMQTDSGRSKCRAPNMQQVPTRGKIAPEIKKAIVTPNDDDFYLCTIDYASLQLRLCCMDEDGRDTMYDAFQDLGVDIHSATGFSTFVKGREMDVEIITVEQDGKTYEFLGGESVITVNRGEVHARDLTEEDTLKV